MANTSSPPHDLALPATHAIEDMANVWYENRAGRSTTHELFDRSAFPFLRLPVELQVKVVDQISKYSDLKAFLLTSKELSDLATPCLYKIVDLRSHSYDEKISQKIESLLAEPANLRFVRVLKTRRLGLEATKLMDRLLPLLREDFLTGFVYATKSVKRFPTPAQLQLLWGRQKNLRNLKLYSHIVPSLEEFFNKSELNQRALLKSFAKLTISDNSETRSDHEFKMISWPLKNLDLYLLQDISFHGQNNTKASNILSSLNPLFVARSFVSLMKLSFKRICFDETLMLTNMPLLERLIVDCCRAPPGQPLVHASNFQLQCLVHRDSEPLEEISRILTHITGLENLVISCPIIMNITTRVQIGLIHAISMHKETLSALDLELYPLLETNTEAMNWDTSFVLNLQDCKNLVELSLPLIPTRPTSYYRELIAALPRLSSLNVYSDIDLDTKWTPYLALHIFPVSSRLGSIVFKNYSLETFHIIRRGF